MGYEEYAAKFVGEHIFPSTPEMLKAQIGLAFQQGVIYGLNSGLATLQKERACAQS